MKIKMFTLPVLMSAIMAGVAFAADQGAAPADTNPSAPAATPAPAKKEHKHAKHAAKKIKKAKKENAEKPAAPAQQTPAAGGETK